ncbi:protein-disulfide reductase DsbD N-terminal domain-containing protein [Pedobacter sp. SL55]|uniref:protein-disulfide reductase DsbD N-terminal domain-containing protein n=1 Tax=Pedobacter sp. SL55 TaxID=2995161 RepID=UPI002D1E497A|nr:protein-disulfide reductase DsbD N-terminal domain-containing protein [Pedobacter sp. SL55]
MLPKKLTKKEAILYLKASIEPGWHLYSQKIKAGGPVATTFTFTPSKTYTKNGVVMEPKAIEKEEKVFNMTVGYFENSAIFQQKIKLVGKTPFTVKGKVEYMVCNDKQCLPPTEVEFNIPVK